MSDHNPPDRDHFAEMYEGRPPWDISGPQTPFVDVADNFSGRILDAGCGTGENALFFAQRGHEVTGIDFLEKPVEMARAKARDRGLVADFLVADALELEHCHLQFDNVIDCGLFHVFRDEQRPRYVTSLASVLRPGGHLFLMCFSDEEPGTDGPRRVSQAELRAEFAEGWSVSSIEPVRFQVSPDRPVVNFSAGGPKAWFAVIQRTP